MNRKINNICKVTFYPVERLASEETYPGLDTVKFTGEGESVEVTAAQFEEVDMASSECEQSFNGVVTDTSGTKSLAVFNICARLGLLELTLSTNEKLVVGSTEFPVVLIASREGSPMRYRLSFRRNSAERAKYRVF